MTARHIADLHRSLKAKPVTAHRVVRLVRSFYYWLAKRELVSEPNPAGNTEWFAEQGRERFLTVEEMGRLGQAFRIAETTRLPHAPVHGPALERRRVVSKKRPRNAGMFSSEL